MNQLETQRTQKALNLLHEALTMSTDASQLAVGLVSTEATNRVIEAVRLLRLNKGYDGQHLR